MTAEFHRLVPRDPVENVKFRMWLLTKAAGDEEIQQLLFEMCKADILFFILAFVWQSNPNMEEGMEVGPFILWQFQDEATLTILDQITGRRDLAIEKSREMGASWLCLIIMVWFILFHRNKKFLLVSRNAEAVDKPEDSDSLFWKVDFIIAHLPHWMARVTQEKGDGGFIRRRKMGIRNQRTESSITGQATTAKAGIGGRATAMFVDEFSQIDDDRSILDGTADTTKCRIFNGTHIGTNTAFYDICTGGYMRKLVVHWSEHPEKRKGLYRSDPSLPLGYEVIDTAFDFDAICGHCDPKGECDKCLESGEIAFKFVTDGTPGGPFPGIRSPWYDGEVQRRQSSRRVAMDLDIDPTGASHQFFDKVQLERYIRDHCCEPIWVGDVSFDSETCRPSGLVRHDKGMLKLWINPKADNRPEPGPYVIALDPSWGTGATPSCVTIAHAETGHKVGEYTDANIKPVPLARLCVALAWLFKNIDGDGAKMVWEIQGPGTAFGPEVLKLGYTNVYYRQEEMGTSRFRSTNPGWSSTGGGKEAILEKYRMALFERKFMNYSEPAIRECLAFIYKGKELIHSAYEIKGDPSQARENHADHVIADALANKLIEEMGKRITGLQKREIENQFAPNTLAGRWRLQDNRRKAATQWS